MFLISFFTYPPCFPSTGTKPKALKDTVGRDLRMILICCGIIIRNWWSTSNVIQLKVTIAKKLLGTRAPFRVECHNVQCRVSLLH